MIKEKLNLLICCIRALGVFYPIFETKKQAYNLPYYAFFSSDLNFLYNQLNSSSTVKFIHRLMGAFKNINQNISGELNKKNTLYLEDIHLCKQYLTKFKYFYFQMFEKENIGCATFTKTKNLNSLAIVVLFQLAKI